MKGTGAASCNLSQRVRITRSAAPQVERSEGSEELPAMHSLSPFTENGKQTTASLCKEN